MKAYYNEIDAGKCAWLSELIKNGIIADGDVDQRDIKEVQPQDLARYTQCHWFAGIGVWSYALRLAGWPDDRPVWTGSCPCPSFSAAGKGAGFDDPRHLWSDWARFIRECKPAIIFGEQTDDAIGYGWLDLIQNDLEGANYAVGKAVLGACSVGAPHIRQRLYFVAHTEHPEWRSEYQEHSNSYGRDGFRRSSIIGVALGDAHDSGSQGRELFGAIEGGDGASEFVAGKAGGVDCGMGFPNGDRWKSGNGSAASARQRDSTVTTSFWSECTWLPCIDGKARPVEPGTFPLVAGASNCVLKLRGYGDCIVAPLAAEFIQAYLEAVKD